MPPKFKVGGVGYFYNGAGYFFDGKRDAIFRGTIERVLNQPQKDRIVYVLQVIIEGQAKEHNRIWVDERDLMPIEEATARRLRL